MPPLPMVALLLAAQLEELKERHGQPHPEPLHPLDIRFIRQSPSVTNTTSNFVTIETFLEKE